MRTRNKADLNLRRVRSAITNGSALIADCDMRSAWARRLRDIVHAHVADLGGEDNISHSERALVVRSAMLLLQMEMLEQVFAKNNGVATPRQLLRYQRSLNSLRRVFETLGLGRRAKPVPSLAEYIDTEYGSDDPARAAE